MRKKLIAILLIFLSACASVSGPKKQPWIYEEPIAGNHDVLASCVVRRLQSDGRWSIRMLQLSNRLYPDINASEIYAYDMRFLPGIYARNSPTNPDAVFDFVDPNPEIRSYQQNNTSADTVYAFALLIKQIDEQQVKVTLKGNKHVASIAWEHLQACALSKGKS